MPLVSRAYKDTLFVRSTYAVFRASLSSQYGSSSSAYSAAKFASSVANAVSAGADAAASAVQASGFSALASANSYANATAPAVVDAATFGILNAGDSAIAASANTSTGNDIWRAFRKDFLLCAEEKSSLLKNPLWVEEPGWFRLSVADWTRRLADLSPEWGLVIHWYKQVCVDATQDPFRSPKLKAIGNESSSFWGAEKNSSRTPQVVMIQIAERLGWSLERPAETLSNFILRYLKERHRPVQLSELFSAFERAGYFSPQSSIKGRLYELVKDDKVQRVGRGLYVANDRSLPRDWPEAIEGVKSPFDYGWTTDGKIALIGDALGRVFAPEYRSPDDSRKRLEAARRMAESVAREVQSGKFQIGDNYTTDLQNYSKQLPGDIEGNIYLADSIIRTLRDDLEDDLRLGFVSERAARRLKRVIEAHYGLRVYFPDLQGFYDDVKRGELAEPPPIEAMRNLSEAVEAFTPDVFDESVVDTVDERCWPTYHSTERSSVKVEEATELTVDLPPDPISDVDPVQSDQAARAGAFNRLWGILKQTEKAAKNVERAEKVADIFARNIDEVIGWLSKIVS